MKRQISGIEASNGSGSGQEKGTAAHEKLLKLLLEAMSMDEKARNEDSTKRSKTEGKSQLFASVQLSIRNSSLAAMLVQVSEASRYPSFRCSPLTYRTM